MKNIILIGMPGAGKSTIGVVLAKKTGYSFIDSDLLIQEREKMLLYEIIEQKGLETFKQIENEVNAAIQTERSIIATGGSVIYGKKAMAHFQAIGSIIYLKLDYQEIENRVGNLEQRGVVLPPGYTLKELYQERTPLYEKYADFTIDCNNKSIREIVTELCTSKFSI
ncbi:MAG TPA: shikimate kinase [Lachnospiraceae bacterium]|nr:shikimate kinase [Lachnospiraceae bacterium]